MVQSEVSIRKETHQYFDTAGNEYVPVSRILDSLEEKFDAQMISASCAGKGQYAGMSQQQVLKAWDDNRIKASDHGTRIHDALERFTQHFQIQESDNDLEPMLKSIANEYIGYHRAHSEIVLYSPMFANMGLRVAGTADRVLVTSPKGGYVDLEDYKTNLSKGIQFYSQDKKGKGTNKYYSDPLGHLQDCNYNRYCLQLAIYGLMYEELTGAKIRSMWIRFIPADDPLNHRRIPVPNMRFEALELLQYHANQAQENKMYQDVKNIQE